MSGKIKILLDNLIEQRARGNVTIIATTKNRLLLKGIDYSKYTDDSPDDEAVIEKVQQAASDMGIMVK